MAQARIPEWASLPVAVGFGIAETFAAVLILVPRFRPRFFWPRSLGLILLLFGYQCFSVASSQPQIFGVFELTKTVRALVVFLAAGHR